MSKKAAEARHAKKRALQRYGVKINRQDFFNIKKMVGLSRTKPLERRSNRVCVHEIEYAGKTMRIVYDSLRGQVVTFL